MYEVFRSSGIEKEVMTVAVIFGKKFGMNIPAKKKPITKIAIAMRPLFFTIEFKKIYIVVLFLKYINYINLTN